MKRIVVLVVDSLIRMASIAFLFLLSVHHGSHGCHPRQKKF